MFFKRFSWGWSVFFLLVFVPLVCFVGTVVYATYYPGHLADWKGRQNLDKWNTSASNIVYFRDSRTDLCYAMLAQGLTLVPCDKVEKYLVNPEKLEPTPEVGQ